MTRKQLKRIASKISFARYKGGRCEVKKIGKLNVLIYHTDVNSMYTALTKITASKAWPITS